MSQYEFNYSWFCKSFAVHISVGTTLQLIMQTEACCNQNLTPDLSLLLYPFLNSELSRDENMFKKEFPYLDAFAVW